MTTLSLRAGYPAQTRREFSRAVTAVAAIFEMVVDVLAEAEHQSSEARSRFPFAD
jgi:hypothetical protein